MFDLGTLRGIFTAILLALFIALVFWTFSSKRKASFDRAARAALDDDPIDENSARMKEPNP
jgi:cytochrome c oxidase cbb3-type subunit 4